LTDMEIDESDAAAVPKPSNTESYLARYLADCNINSYMEL